MIKYIDFIPIWGYIDVFYFYINKMMSHYSYYFYCFLKVFMCSLSL